MLLTSNWEDLTDVDSEQAEAASANKAQSLQVQQGRCVLEALKPSQLLHTQNQCGPAPVKDTQQGVKTLLQKQTRKYSHTPYHGENTLQTLFDPAIVSCNRYWMKITDKQWMIKTILTTETVRAKERLRIWTGSLVCCFPLDALPSFEGSLMLKYKKNKINFYYYLN